MKKVHQKPEFQIIVQNQANAKFFVASNSFGPKPGQVAPQADDPTHDPGAVNSYGRDANGFTF